MRLAKFTLVPAIFCAILFAQAGAVSSALGTFHMQGTVTDPNGAVVPNVKVVFRNGSSQINLITNETGLYQTDLRPGLYTMTAQFLGFKTYHRPLFRVESGGNATLDIRLQLPRCGDMVIVPTTDAAIDAATEFCRHEDTFSLPGKKGDGFAISIQYESRTSIRNGYVYEGAGPPARQPIFLAYNLFSLCADHLVYDVKQKTIEASGNVSVQDESVQQKADSMTFKFKEGQVVRLR
jgi:hypothetical protein